MHTALETNLWVFGSDYALLSSNETLRRIITEYTTRNFSGPRAQKRPDLLLMARFDQKYVLVEFKRPSHTITREDQLQAEKYRDDLAQFRPMDILLVGRDNDRALNNDRPDYVHVVSYSATVSKARAEIGWLLKELVDYRQASA
jgi:hypothetical protein